VLASCSGKKEEKLVEKKASVDSLEVSKIVSLGRIEPESKISSLAMNATGLLAELSIKEGDRVKKGTTLLVLDSEKELADLNLKKSKIYTQEQEILVKGKEIAKANVDVEENERKLKRSEALNKKGAETLEALEDARAVVTSAKADIARLEAALISTRTKLGELRADVAVSEAELHKRKLLAPVGGTILSIKPTLGSLIQTGTAVIDFAPEGVMTALAEVDELFVDKVAIGQLVDIMAQGGDKILAKGKIIFIAPTLKKKSLFSDDSNNLEDRRVREVRIELENASGLLYNSRVECVIHLKSK